MRADRRQVFARVEIDYTDPFMDQSLNIAVSERANVSYPQQTADSVLETTYKWISLDGSWVLDGSYRFAPSADKLAQYQFGWWGKQLAGAGGVFLSPYPSLTVTHLPRPIHTLRVVGDTARGEYPVDFTIKLYAQNEAILYTETVTGNTQVNWSKTLAVPVLDVAKQVMEITRWSHEGRQAKIIEFFTSIREIYETGDLVSLHLLEEREASQGSLPVGNVSANEIVLRFNNEDGKFDVDNEQSPLANLLKANRRIRAWLGGEVEVPEEIVEDFTGGDKHQTTTDGGDLVLAQYEVEGKEPSSLEYDEDLSQGELDGVVAGEDGLELEEVESPTFTRTSKAYLSDGTQVAANAPRFELGKFGKAIMVEEGTENIIPIADWNTLNGWVSAWATQTRTIETTGLLFNGVNILKSVIEDTGQGIAAYKDFAVVTTPGVVYTISAYVKSQGRPVMIWCHDGSNNGQVFSSSNVPGTDFTRLTAKFTTTGTGYCRVHFLSISGNVGDIVWVTAPQLEQKTYATSFIDGTRAAESLTIPTAGVLNPQEGTVALYLYVNPAHREPSRTRQFFRHLPGPGNANCISMQHNDANFWLFTIGDANGNTHSLSIADNEVAYGWRQFVMKWGAEEFAVYVDGIKKANLLNPTYLPSSVGDIITVSGYTNALLDDLAIFDYAPTDEEIQAWYEADAPIPITEHTTYLLRFDNDFVVGKGGARKSLPLDLSSIGTVKTSEISWQATEPTGTSITIETALSTDGGQTWGAWQTATNGQAIPGILPDMDLSNTRLKTRATLETTDTDITPTLEGLNINLTGEKTTMLTVYFDQGHYTSDPIPLSSISRVRAGSMAWQATLPEGTTATVETALSLDGGQTYSPWQEVQPGQPIPGIEKGQDLANAYLKIRANLATKDVEVTPILPPITIYLYPLDNPTVIEEYIPLGTFWSLDWDSPDDTLEATVTARDRMELLRKGTYQTSQVLTNKSLYELAEGVLQDAGLSSNEYVIDTTLNNIRVPYAWFNPVSHREALRRIAEAGLAAAFQNRDGKIQVESFLITGDEPVLEITEDDYFPPLRAPSRQDQVANEIIVDTQPLRPAAVAEEVYKSNEPITIPGNTTKTITAFYNQPPVIETQASLDNPPAGVSIVDATYYGWGASVSIRNTNASDRQVTLVIQGKPLTVQNKERAIARDEASILENGVLRYEFPANPLVQTLAQAQAIADTLLASVKEPRRDIEVEWRGNPALELGDRVTVKGRDYHVIRQELDWQGYLQARLTGRKA